MKGLKVKCPNCKRICFETTDKYDPSKTPNGSMVRSLMRYQIDWLCSSVTTVAEMTCPECLAQLAPGGRLTVLPPETAAPESSQAQEGSKPVKTGLSGDLKPQEDAAGHPAESKFICDICGKEFKSQAGLFGHRKAHTKKEEANNG